jgi:Ricin-type beta-trefoil lectin domain/Lysozyme like domain
MPERAETPVIRRYRPSATSFALSAACLALCALATGAATRAATGAVTGAVARAVTGPAARDAATAAGWPPPSARPATGLVVHMTAAAQASAATRCARWATAAGFANDGYLSGSLVTAVAISLAESGCTPGACFDDTRREPCTEQAIRRQDSVDRGAWQLNSKAWASISDQCAFSGPCAARAAYLTISSDGTFFARWTQYATDAYAHYVWPAQRAVSALRSGTVASALAGSCLGYPRDQRGTAARLANCSEGGSQTWYVVGSALHTQRGLCLSAAATGSAAAVTLARCNRGSKLQQWRPTRFHQLYNPGAHRCLDDPTGGDTPGLLLTADKCATTRPQTWFKP